jgi:hypothetical protein
MAGKRLGLMKSGVMEILGFYSTQSFPHHHPAKHRYPSSSETYAAVYSYQELSMAIKTTMPTSATTMPMNNVTIPDISRSRFISNPSSEYFCRRPSNIQRCSYSIYRPKIAFQFRSLRNL